MPMPIKFKKSKTTTDLEEKVNSKVESIYLAAKNHDLPKLKKFKNDINIKCCNDKEIDGIQIDNGTPLHFACANGDADAIQLLLVHGANPYLLQSENEGLAPIHFAAQENHLECIKTLHRHHPNTIHTESYLKEHALHIAASKSHFDMMKWLINHGADVNHQDHNGDTPLHNVIRQGNLDNIQILLCNGADPCTQNHLSESPINIARKLGNSKIYELLEEVVNNDSKNEGEEDGNRKRNISILRPYIKDSQNIPLKDSIEGDVMQKNFHWMCKFINSSNIADSLHNKAVLPRDEVEKIKQQSNAEKKASTLLNLLMLQDAQVFYTLIEVLKSIDSVHQKLAHLLTKEVDEKRKQSQVKQASCVIS